MQQLLSIDDIREALQDRRLTVVAEKSGLSHPTVKAVATGKRTNQSEHLEEIVRISHRI